MAETKRQNSQRNEILTRAVMDYQMDPEVAMTMSSRQLEEFMSDADLSAGFAALSMAGDRKVAGEPKKDRGAAVCSPLGCFPGRSRPLAQNAAWKDLFGRTGIVPLERDRFSVVDCGGLGNCFFLSIAGTLNELFPMLTPRFTGADVRQWVANALLATDAQIYGSSFLNHQLEEWKDSKAEEVAWAPVVVEMSADTDDARLESMRIIVTLPNRDSATPALFQGDLATLTILQRPGAMLDTLGLGFIVFALTSQGSGRPMVANVVCESFVTPRTRYISLLYSTPGHWQLIAYDNTTVFPLDAIPQTIHRMVQSQCGQSTWLLSAGLDTFRRTDCTTLPVLSLPYSSLVNFADSIRAPYASKAALCRTIIDWIDERKLSPESASALSPSLALTRQKAEAPFPGLFTWKPETKDSPPMVRVDEDEGLRVGEEAPRTWTMVLPWKARASVPTKTRVRRGQVVATWTCREIPLDVILDAAREIKVAEPFEGVPLCRSIQARLAELTPR